MKKEVKPEIAEYLENDDKGKLQIKILTYCQTYTQREIEVRTKLRLLKSNLKQTWEKQKEKTDKVMKTL